MAAQGRVLGGRYELQSLVAVGGMGQVWRARDARLKRSVAVKVVGGGVTADPLFRVRFRDEAQHAAQLNHPNIASVHDYGEDPGGAGDPVAYLVMELVDGEPLSGLLARAGRLHVQQTLDVVRQTAAALAVAHAAGVVHRDVKPANVLVRPDGVVKITDFGIAWSASSAAVTRTGQVIGTAHYLSPEQAEGAKATPASDVYALGLVMYECLAGRRAFDGENPVQIALKQIRDTPPPLPPDVPAEVRALVARATAKNPAQRLPDGAAFRDELDRLLARDGALVSGAAPTLVDPLAGAGPAARPASGPAPTAVLPVVTGAAGGGKAPAAAPASSPRRRGLVVTLAVAALAVVAAVVAAVASSGSGGLSSPSARSAAASSSPTSRAAPTTVSIALVASQEVGRQVEQVKADLSARGLQVQLAPVATGSVPAGQVTAVDPIGQLTPGTIVTVSYAVAPTASPTTTKAPTTGNGGPAKAGDKKHGGGKSGKDD